MIIFVVIVFQKTKKMAVVARFVMAVVRS